MQKAHSPGCVFLGKTFALSESVYSTHGGGAWGSEPLQAWTLATAKTSQEWNQANSKPVRMCPQIPQGTAPRLQQLPSSSSSACTLARASLEDTHDSSGFSLLPLGLSVSSVKWSQASCVAGLWE